VPRSEPDDDNSSPHEDEQETTLIVSRSSPIESPQSEYANAEDYASTADSGFASSGNRDSPAPWEFDPGNKAEIKPSSSGSKLNSTSSRKPSPLNTNVVGVYYIVY
jgi:hypothetical protein